MFALRQTLIRAAVPARVPNYNLFARSFSTPAFNKAVEDLNRLREVDNDGKLKLYALYKQATVGANTTEKPSMFNMVASAKWNAWNSLGNMPKDVAIETYISTVRGLAKAQGINLDADASTDAPPPPQLNTSLVDGILKIELNRPDKLNALTYEMYVEITRLVNSAQTNPDVKVIYWTGAGTYFSAGNDLSIFTRKYEGDLYSAAREILKNFVSAFINCPVPIVVAVNGPAIGLAVTTLGLCDFVYGSNKSTYATPFMTLAQSPEACSSYLFPQMMGKLKANEILMLGKKFSSEEALKSNLLTDVVESSQLQEHAFGVAKQIASLPPGAIRDCKKLTVFDKDVLHKVNEVECDIIMERWKSDECKQAIQKFFSRSK